MIFLSIVADQYMSVVFPILVSTVIYSFRNGSVLSRFNDHLQLSPLGGGPVSPWLDSELN